MNYKLFDYFLLFQFVKSFIAKLQEKFIKFINSYVKISSKLPDIHISCIVVSQQKYLSLHIKISSKYHARYIFGDLTDRSNQDITDSGMWQYFITWCVVFTAVNTPGYDPNLNYRHMK